MLDHIFLSVSDITRSITFYSQALAPLGITDRLDCDGKDGPPRHPDASCGKPDSVLEAPAFVPGFDDVPVVGQAVGMRFGDWQAIPVTVPS
jgi:catechol 2,3-dioxygenase-like lactoylglutathione lyase family enzyme